MAKEKRTSKAQEELEQITSSSSSSECPDSCSSVSSDCSLSSKCQ